MKYCKSCGNPIDDNAKFCAVCGKKDESAERKSNGSVIDDAVNRFTNTADTTADYSVDDINDNRIMAILAYIGLLVLVPLLAAKNSPFARFHANQGLLLLILELISSFVASIIPWIGWLVGALLSVLCFALFILGLINAVKGNAKELPLIGKFRILK